MKYDLASKFCLLYVQLHDYANFFLCGSIVLYLASSLRPMIYNICFTCQARLPVLKDYKLPPSQKIVVHILHPSLSYCSKLQHLPATI